MSLLIFLNGCSSAGKTSIAHSIQHLSDTPWLRLGLDIFIDMVPDKFIGFGEQAKNGYFSFTPRKNERGSLIQIENGPLGEKFFDSAPAIAQLLADQGNNLIIDEVLFGNEILKSYVYHLNSHTVYFVGVFCDLKSLQEREILRRDRAIGLANDQIDRVHDGIREYDLKVDSTHTSPFVNAHKIIEFIAQNPTPVGFHNMRKFVQ